MTKKEALKAKADWTLAVAEGRVVRYEDRLTSYPTVAAALDAVTLAQSCEMSAEIVKV